MKNLAKAVLFSLPSTVITLSAFAKNTPQHTPTSVVQESFTSPIQQAITTKGAVKLIDIQTKKITIAHDPIPSINWPAMTMRFTYKEHSMIENISINDQVTLDFIQQGNIALLTKIEKTQ